MVSQKHAVMLRIVVSVEKLYTNRIIWCTMVGTSIHWVVVISLIVLSWHGSDR